MSICHYLGLNDDFKGIFEGLEIVEAIELLKQGSKEFEKIIIYLELESKKNILRLRIVMYILKTKKVVDPESQHPILVIRIMKHSITGEI